MGNLDYNRKKSTVVTDLVYIVLLLIMTVGYTEFFHRQAIRYNDKYISDLIVYAQHIGDVEESRMIAWVFGRLNGIDGGNYAGLSIFMALLVAATVIAGFFFISFLLDRENCGVERWKRQLASFCVLFSGPIYVPGLHEHFYSGTWPKYAWHSPTEIAMVLFAIISLHLFIRMFDDYMEHISFANWLGLVLAFFLSCWAKPNFILVFAPVLLIIMLIELIRRREYGFMHRVVRIVMMGSTIIPAGIFILILNRLEFSGDDDGGIAVNIGYFLKDIDHPAVMIICCIAFPLFVLLFNLRKLGDIALASSLGCFVAGTAEYLILVEAGSRINHGNFGWSRQVGEYLFFAVAVALFIGNWKDKSFLGSKPAIRKIYLVIGFILLAAHVVSQLLYVMLIMTGRLYRM